MDRETLREQRRKQRKSKELLLRNIEEVNDNNEINNLNDIFNAKEDLLPDEIEEEKIKSEVDNQAKDPEKSFRQSGEGRKASRRRAFEEEEARLHKFKQVDKEEENYDNYYESLTPDDKGIYEARSSSKVYVISFITLLIASIVIGVLVAISGVGDLIG